MIKFNSYAYTIIELLIAIAISMIIISIVGFIYLSSFRYTLKSSSKFDSYGKVSQLRLFISKTTSKHLITCNNSDIFLKSNNFTSNTYTEESLQNLVLEQFSDAKNIRFACYQILSDSIIEMPTTNNPEIIKYSLQIQSNFKLLPLEGVILRENTFSFVE